MDTPLPGLPQILLDSFGNNIGVAQQVARSRNAQGRVLWIDATANIVRTNTEEKIVNVVDRIKRAGFNTIVYDVKPIVGYTTYPSKLAPKLVEWSGNHLPEDFDPLRVFEREAKKQGLSLWVSLNAFSEGHRNVTRGPGYDKPEWQTVLYELKPTFRSSFSTRPSFPALDQPNVMPTSEDVLGVFTVLDRVPTTRIPGDAYGAIMDARGNVVAQTTGPELRSLNFAMPAGGSVMLGFGRAGQFIRLYAKPYDTMTLETEPQFVRISERPQQQIPLMMNPNHPQVQEHALKFIDELMTNYQLDGLIYDDRLRYGGMNADFSDVTRRQFEQYVGERVNWPNDVFQFTLLPNWTRGLVPGKHYDAWMTFRALTLRNWVERARNRVKKARPEAQFGVYAGSWYGEYQHFGNNYASPDWNAGFWFVTPQYRKTGFAPLLDLLITGAYYPTGTIADALAVNQPIGFTVEAAGQLSNRAARDECWTYAGIMLSTFRDNPEGLRRALQAACASTQGVMVFDLSHDIEPFWPVFEQAFFQAKPAPHSLAGLLAEVRDRREKLDKSGYVDPPTIITAGAAGTGM
jgi:uncharacterized lipoprotein YddW (UPF0748 family)